METYQTLVGTSFGEYKEKGSKFYAYARPVLSAEDAELQVEQLWGEHPKARHICYAYLINKDKYRANDDGEPSNSAGSPILGQIRSKQLQYVLVAVVRYFGGTKLGVGGLINAYRTSAAEALEAGEIKLDFEKISFNLVFQYTAMESIMSYVKSHANVRIENKVFEENCILKLACPKGEFETHATYFKNKEATLKL